MNQKKNAPKSHSLVRPSLLWPAWVTLITAIALMTFAAVARADAPFDEWWDSNYLYRKKITHTADAIGANLTQIHYRWRNDDGVESGGLDTGTGADGSVTIPSSQNINTAILESNQSSDAADDEAATAENGCKN